MGTLREQIDALRSLAPRLNAATDDAARLVRAVEAFLNDECQFGIYASLECPDRDDYGAEEHSGILLEYVRNGGQFRLCVADYTYQDGGVRYLTGRNPWSDCSRETKLTTIELLPGLLGEISRQVQNTIENAEERAKRIEGQLQEFGISTMEAK